MARIKVFRIDMSVIGVDTIVERFRLAGLAVLEQRIGAEGDTVIVEADNVAAVRDALGPEPMWSGVKITAQPQA